MNEDKIIQELLKDLEKIEADLIKRIEAALKIGYFTDVELTQLVAELDFYQELNNLGYASKLEKYFDNFDEIFLAINEQAKQRGLAGITGVAARDLDTLIQVKANELLGKAEYYAKQLRSRLVENLVAGTPVNQLVESLKEIPLKDYELTVALNSGIARFERSATAKVYEESPEQRFILFGVLDERTRASCQAVLENQDKKGYTKKQIDGGEVQKLVNLYAIDYANNKSSLEAALENNYGFANCGGFNCRHRWRPL